MVKPKEPENEQLTEVEMLKLHKALLTMDVFRLQFEKAEREKNEMVRDIIAAHRFAPNSTVKFPEGILEGERLDGPKAISDDQGSDNS